MISSAKKQSFFVNFDLFSVQKLLLFEVNDFIFNVVVPPFRIVEVKWKENLKKFVDRLVVREIGCRKEVLLEKLAPDFRQIGKRSENFSDSKFSETR